MKLNLYRCDLCKKEHKQFKSANLRFLQSGKQTVKVGAEDICKDCEHKVLTLINSLTQE